MSSSPERALVRVVERATAVLAAIDEAASKRSPGPGKWSPRELVGHLVDSASNNHQRFVRAALADHLDFPGYDQDAWVALQAYDAAPWRDLVELFRQFNLQLARVMAAIPPEARALPRPVHSVDRIGFRPFPAGEPVTLEWFMEDYVVHLEHHIDRLAG